MYFRQSIHTAVSLILEGGVIAYPTEGVFGLGCDPFNADAVSRVLAIKQRPVDKGLILIADSLDTLQPYLQPLSASQTQLLNQHWPGPFTFVIPHNGLLPEWITGGRETVAVRIPSHPIARQLCRTANMPLVSSSANHSGKPPLITALQTRSILGRELDCIVKGAVQTPGKASQIIDLVSGKHFRA